MSAQLIVPTPHSDTTPHSSPDASGTVPAAVPTEDSLLAEMAARPHGELPRERRRALTEQMLLRAHETADPAVREDCWSKVVLMNMGVARSVAMRHRGKGIPTEDLEQVAYMALVGAVHRFDATRERDFLSFAVPTMRGEVRRYFRDLGWTVRPPRRVQEIQTRVLQARDNTTRHGGVADVGEIAETLGESVDDVREALTAEGCFHPSSLDAPVSDDSAHSLGDALTAEDDHATEAAEARVVLRPVLRRLRPRDRRILELRFIEGCTQQEVADDIGVTQMQVSRLLARIMRDLRGWLEEEPEHAEGRRAG